MKFRIKFCKEKVKIKTGQFLHFTKLFDHDDSNALPNSLQSFLLFKTRRIIKNNSMVFCLKPQPYRVLRDLFSNPIFNICICIFVYTYIHELGLNKGQSLKATPLINTPLLKQSGASTIK